MKLVIRKLVYDVRLLPDTGNNDDPVAEGRSVDCHGPTRVSHRILNSELSTLVATQPHQGRYIRSKFIPRVRSQIELVSREDLVAYLGVARAPACSGSTDIR